MAESSYQAASGELHKQRGVGPDDIVDVTVTRDGTWSRRGFMGIYGVVAVISWETGQVLDTIVLCKRALCVPRWLVLWENLIEGRLYLIEGRCPAVKGSTHAYYFSNQILSYFSICLHVYTGTEN